MNYFSEHFNLMVETLLSVSVTTNINEPVF